jgi:hypothetical protein
VTLLHVPAFRKPTPALIASCMAWKGKGLDVASSAPRRTRLMSGWAMSRPRRSSTKAKPVSHFDGRYYVPNQFEVDRGELGCRPTPVAGNCNHQCGSDPGDSSRCQARSGPSGRQLPPDRRIGQPGRSRCPGTGSSRHFGAPATSTSAMEMCSATCSSGSSRRIAAGLVAGEGSAADASLIQADTNKQRSIAGQDWRKDG